MGRSIFQALHTYPQSESTIAQGLFSQRATRVLLLRLFSSAVLTLHSPKAKSMSLARFSRHPGEASQEGRSKQDLSSNVFSGSLRRDRAQVIRRGQTPAKREARKKLRDVATPQQAFAAHCSHLGFGASLAISPGDPGRAANARR